jgi:putative tricarboxylic transport membrane protein
VTEVHAEQHGRLRTEPAGAAEVQHGSATGPFVAGAVLVAFGAVMLTQVFGIEDTGLSLGGPRFFPLVVLSLLTVLSAVYLVQQCLAVARRSGRLPAEPFTHLTAAGLLVGLLVVYALVLAPLGYLLSTSVFFVGAARAMGSRHLTRDVVVGIGLTVLVYFAFTRALGVSLPAGVLPL